MTQIHDCTLVRRPSPGASGYMYDVFYDGAWLVSSRDPEHAACRALELRGHAGEARFWREGKDHYDSRFACIRRGGAGSTQDSNRDGLRTVAYRPFEGV